MDTPPVTRHSEAQSFSTAPTEVMTFLAAGDQSSPDIVTERLAPGDGPPLHRHPWVHWEVVTEGRIRAMVGEETFELEPGDMLYAPSGVPHTFMAVGDADAQVVGIYWPGGFHRLMAELEPLFDTGGPPDFGAVAETAARHGAEILGPPMAQLDGASG